MSAISIAKPHCRPVEGYPVKYKPKPKGIRMQYQEPLGYSYMSMERRLLKWRRPGKRFERLTGIHPADRNILFRGIWHRMACSGFSSFVLVGSYFLAIDHLVSR
ncbi:unnamed protein product [Ilex paraguariensis]|uniref:Uncharacterized protein n=1 Tax=Ilex paraguariensis TaxID=185542 RepID=A0ABC8SU75_9AQUA